MLSVLTEQRISVKFLFQLEKFETETHHLLNKVYDNECLSHAGIFDWFKRFQDGHEDIEDYFRLARSSTSTTEKNFDINGIVYLHCVPEAQTINQHYYREILAQLR